MSRKKRIIIAIVLGILAIAIGVLAVMNAINGSADTEEDATTEVIEGADEQFVSLLGYELTQLQTLSITSTQGSGGIVDMFQLAIDADEETDYGMSIMARSATEHVPGTPEGYPGVDAVGRAYETLTINELPAVRLSDNPATLEDYWVYTPDKTRVVRVTISGSDTDYVAAYQEILYTFRWQ